MSRVVLVSSPACRRADCERTNHRVIDSPSDRQKICFREQRVCWRLRACVEEPAVFVILDYISLDGYAKHVSGSTGRLSPVRVVFTNLGNPGVRQLDSEIYLREGCAGSRMSEPAKQNLVHVAGGKLEINVARAYGLLRSRSGVGGIAAPGGLLQAVAGNRAICDVAPNKVLKRAALSDRTRGKRC